MNRRLIVALLGLLTSTSGWAQNAMPTLQLSAGFHRIEAEVAANDRNPDAGHHNGGDHPQTTIFRELRQR